MQTQLLFHGRLCVFTHRTPLPAPEALGHHFATLLLSLKNPDFTPELVTWFIDMSKHVFTEAMICVVDTPYRFNLLADAGGIETDMVITKQKHLDQLALERRRMIQRCLNRADWPSVHLVPWSVLDRMTPRWMRTEVQAAFAAQGAFYTLVLDQIRAIRRVPNDHQSLERYAQFLLAEIPVLLLTYYGSTGVVDVYPGPNFELYTALEEGLFTHELPQISAFVQAGSSLISVAVLPLAGAVDPE